MNKTKIFVAYAIAGLALFSCSEDFIDIVPEDSIDKSVFLSNEEELLLGTNGIYSETAGYYESTLAFQIRDGRSDDTGIDQQDQPERIDTETFDETVDNQIVLEQWQNIYQIIDAANLVITSAETATPNAPDGQTLINKYVGEAKFFRALAYFEIVVLWGGNAPLRLEPSFDFDIIVPSSTETAIYDQIIQDLNDAIGVLDANGIAQGRVSRYAAQALLGKVELQRGNASAALAAFQQVEGNFSLLPNYEDIYAPGNDNHAESIFEIGFDKGNRSFLLANGLVHETEMIDLGLEGGTGRTNLLLFPTPDIIAAFSDSNDLRREASFSFEISNPSIPYISKFIDGIGDRNPDINVILIRYADVLLGIAEALGESPEAYEYINRVRRRGYGQDPGVPNPTVDIGAGTPGTFVEKLLNERRLELAFESGHRWRDLRRLVTPSALVTQMQDHLQNLVGRSGNVSEGRLLYPIPAFEVELANGQINQNPDRQ